MTERESYRKEDKYTHINVMVNNTVEKPLPGKGEVSSEFGSMSVFTSRRISFWDTNVSDYTGLINITLNVVRGEPWIIETVYITSK
jgi:hypothetical protein